jgi:hypothetical protein
MTRYVGVDLHRRRSVIVVLDADGTELWTKRIDNDPLTLGLEIEEAGPDPEVVLEATWGWYWAADVITEAGGRVHLAHPLTTASTLGSWLICCGWVVCLNLGSLLRVCVISGSWSVTAGSCLSCGRG